MPFLKEFNECPICHCKDTLCRQACADEPTIPIGTFVSMDKKVTPIQDFTKISTPTTRVLYRQYDTCAECGLDYCVKVELGPMDTIKLLSMLGLLPTQMRQQ